MGDPDPLDAAGPLELLAPTGPRARRDPGIIGPRPAPRPAAPVPWWDEPATPRLRPDMLRGELAEAVAIAYQRARGFARPELAPWVPAPWDLRSMRRVLAACARAMIEHDVDPEGWARWCLAGRQRQTGILAVMSARAVERRAGWYRKVRAQERGGR